jgi:thiocyanate desulfurase
MADERRTKLRERTHLPDLKLDAGSNASNTPSDAPDPVQSFLKRKGEVTQQDHQEFSAYVQEKSARDQQQRVPATDALRAVQSRLNRRSLLKWAAGTTAAGEAAAFGYQMLAGEDVPAHGIMHSGATSAEAQRHFIERELIDPLADIRGRHFGNWVLLMPTKLGGGTYAVNLNTGRTLAWISYWNYGDYNPISHHLCAFPSADPTRGFEWINSTQGGKNSLIYGIPTNIETPAEGFNIYRVRYDGAQMELMENVSETTGLGLGVHVTIDPRTAERYFVTDGQKDIAACFDRRTSRVIAALKYDWVPNVRNLAEAWQKGGVLKISKIYPDAKTGNYDYLGTKGQKIEWEMVPMGELFVEEGTIPGDDVHSLTSADGTIWHPTGRWASTVIRLCGGQVILDAERNFEPIAFLQFNKDAPNQYPITKIDNDH